MTQKKREESGGYSGEKGSDMSSYISREEAMKAINELDDLSDSWGCAIPMEDIKDAIKLLPEADVVEKRRGEWKLVVFRDVDKRYMTVLYECTACECLQRTKSLFCPRCGADMRDGNVPYHHGVPIMDDEMQREEQT